LLLKPNGGRRDEMKYTSDMSKCDRLFDLLLREELSDSPKDMLYLTPIY
jgi:hypothetical protein